MDIAVLDRSSIPASVSLQIARKQVNKVCRFAGSNFALAGCSTRFGQSRIYQNGIKLACELLLDQLLT
jgi:hypothetical protein